jgi:two-component sensor histidine kinase
LNHLQIIVALLSLQGRREVNAEATSHLAAAANRVRAIARLNRHLQSMDDTPTVELKRYLDELCRDHAAMSLLEQRPDQRIVVAIDRRLPATTDSYPFPFGNRRKPERPIVARSP